MKLKTYTLALISSVAFLASCKSPEQNARLAAIGNVAVTYAAAKGAITPEDAAFVRESGKILLTPEPAPAPLALPVTGTK